MFDQEDLMLCDRGEGWYITWDDQVANRLRDAASSRATNLAHPVQTAHHLTDTEETEEPENEETGAHRVMEQGRLIIQVKD